ncbi:hypothetical protein [Ralstonia solanacearum]|uniref:hypothetical protein n=1 Tax=Ralstonia solanacearum TaxID=305 RepID=UPI00399D577D
MRDRDRRGILDRIGGACRVQQEGIGAREPAGSPSQVDQNIDDRLADGLGGAYPHHVAAVGRAHQRGPQRRDDRIVGQARALVGLSRGQSDGQMLAFLLGYADQIDLGLQRLPQIGTHAQTAETRRPRGRLNQQQDCHGDRDGRPARTAQERLSLANLAHPHPSFPVF